MNQLSNHITESIRALGIIVGSMGGAAHYKDALMEQRTPCVPRRSSKRTRSDSALPGRKLMIPQRPHPRKAHSDATSAMPNFSRPAIMDSHAFALSDMRQSPCKVHGVKRWDGHSGTTREWDSLRKDSELWDDGGDCMVHLHSMGKSRRGPSFRLYSKAIQQADCSRLFSQSSLKRFSGHSDRGSLASDSGYSTTSFSDDFDIYLPAPEQASRDDAFAWHLATRNLFAWMLNRPLVGSSLGKSLIDLLERMLALRPASADNVKDCLQFAERMGYLDFTHSPDHASALLRFAEHFQLRELWIDAFVHCVGMNDRLCLSHEFDPVSMRTKALITRASLEMDLHLGRVTRALGNFLEDELSSAHLGLSNAERAHLDIFRSFIFSFYVGQHGYWPPPEETLFSKDLLRSMERDFQSLYEYLVDTQAADSLISTRPASGGLCVLQNVNAFNDRHNYTHLPHSLPLLPNMEDLDRKAQSQKRSRQFTLGAKAAKSMRLLNARTALMAATNNILSQVAESPLLGAYIEFEQETISSLGEKLSIADARKVRWIMIYCAFQMLHSVTVAPAEVRDSFSSPYHMCCLISDTPPWDSEAKSPLATHPAFREAPLPPPDSVDSELESPDERARCASPLSIHPDCESDDYFPNIAFHKRESSGNSFDPATIRPASTSVSRTSSFRSIHKNVVSSLSRRMSVKRASTSPSVPTLCEDLTDDELPPYTSPLVSQTDLPNSSYHRLSPITSIDRDISRTPTLNALMLDGPYELEASESGLMDLSDPFSPNPSTPPFSLNNSSLTSFTSMTHTPAEIPLPLSPLITSPLSPMQRLTNSVFRPSSISSASDTPTRNSICGTESLVEGVISDMSSINGSLRGSLSDGASTISAPVSPVTPTSVLGGFAFSAPEEVEEFRKQGRDILAARGRKQGYVNGHGEEEQDRMVCMLGEMDLLPRTIVVS